MDVVYHGRFRLRPRFRRYLDDGFHIEVFNSQGKKLYQIAREFEKIKFTDKHKDELITLFKKEPMVKQVGWENVKKMYTMSFPKTYPAIQELTVSNNKLYVKTYNIKDEKEEYVILDLKGMILSRIYLPRFKKTSLLA